jgi:hypothetical protein
MIGDGSGVANMRSVRRWSAILALAGAVAAPRATPAQTSVPMEFPPPGTRWITRSVDQTGGSHLITCTALDPVLGDRYARASVLVRQEATETRAKSLIGGARLLHFATHAELNERDPLASDELIGLQRAFLYAGSPAVVTTLRKVDDRASFTLMREFDNQLAKLDPVLALQAAPRAAMKEFPHPFAWAAFGLTGVGR